MIALSGSACVAEKHVQPDVEALRLEERTRGVGAEGALAGGDAYVGSSLSAARSFGANEVYQQSASSHAVLIGPARGMGPAVADGIVVARVMTPFRLRDGRTAWVLLGDYAASRPCAPEAS